MGLLGDIKEATENWKEKNLLFKVISVFAFFLAVSSITSLADIIIEWKGFIKDGINFYQNHISNPIRELFSYSGLSYSSIDIDCLIVIGLAFSTLARGEYLSCRYEKSPKKKFYLSISLQILMYLFFLLLYGYRDNDWEDSFFVACFTSLMLLSPFLYSNKGVYRREALIIPLSALLVVLILAAINKGLTV